MLPTSVEGGKLSVNNVVDVGIIRSFSIDRQNRCILRVNSGVARLDEIDISPILVKDLMEDASGSMITEMSDLAYHAFREPPWNDNLEAARLHFGLGVDLMRRSAKAWIACSKPAP